jgi:hypothetical protein
MSTVSEQLSIENKSLKFELKKEKERNELLLQRILELEKECQRVKANWSKTTH